MRTKIRSLIGILLLLFLSDNLKAADLSTTTCPGAGCVDYNISGQGSIAIQITGTWSGTITFQSTIDNTNYTSLRVVASSDTASAGVTTTTGNGSWQTTIAGLSKVRVVFTSYSSGTAVVSSRTTQSAGKFNGGGGGGAVTGAAIITACGSSDTQVLFTDGTVCAGDSALTWNKTTNILGSFSGLTFANGQGFFDEAADATGLRRSTNPQTLRVYNTYTDATHYEAFNLTWSSNIAFLSTSTIGGSNRDLALRSVGSNLYLQADNGNAPGFTISTTGLTGESTGGPMALSRSATGASNGTGQGLQFSWTTNPTNTSTLVGEFLKISPTINYSNGTPGAGHYEALKINVTETALPTGTNYLIRASAGVAGTTDEFLVDNVGNITAIGLKTTGAASGKTVVCVDTATGRLYASTSGVACTN